MKKNGYNPDSIAINQSINGYLILSPQYTESFDLSSGRTRLTPNNDRLYYSLKGRTLTNKEPKDLYATKGWGRFK